MATNPKMLKIIFKRKPKYVCLVPEKEVTTEGGLNILKHEKMKNFN